jgi:hypothetical protein
MIQLQHDALPERVINDKRGEAQTKLISKNHHSSSNNLIILPSSQNKPEIGHVLFSRT